MEDLKQIQEFFSKPLEEVTKSQMLKKAKKGSYPATLVAIENGKVVAQEKVNTPQEAPAAHSVMAKKYPNAKIRLEDSTGKILEENTTDWPKEVPSRYGDIIFRLVKVMSDKAKYELIDAETGKTWEVGGRVYGTVNQLKASAEDTIKPQGGRQSSQFESVNENEDPIIVKYFKRGDEFIQILVKYEITVGFTTALGSRTALGQQNDQNEAAAQKRVKTIVNNLKANFDLDEIFVEKGQVAGRYYINAFSDDFIDMDVSDIEKAKLNEFGPMAGSGNRDYSTSDLVNRIGELDNILMFDRKAEREWEDISQNYLDGEEGSEYWADLSDQELQDAIDDAESLIKKYRIRESVNEAKGDQIAVGNYVKTQDGDIYKRVEGTVGGRPAFVDVVADKKGKLKVGKRKTGLHDSVKLTLVNKGELEESLNEASKGALNYFNDLKYYYQKAFRYLDVEEREEYKQLAKDFFSRLQIDDKVRAVGLEESVNEGAEDIMDAYNDVLDLVKNHSRKLSDDDSYAFGLKLKSWFNKNILFEATKKEYDALLDKEHELTKAYSKDKTDANWKKLSAIRKKGKKLEKELKDQGLLEYNTGLDYHPSKEKSSSNSKKSSLKKVKDMIKRAVKEGDITVDDKTEFKIDLKHLLDKHVVKSEALSDFEEEDVNYDELYSDYKYKVNEAKPKKGHGEKISKEVFAKLKGKTISYKGADYKVVDSDEAVLTLKDEDGKSKTINLRQFNVSGMIEEIFETIELGKQLEEGKLCPKGEAYRKRRMAAGEKSSAYLSGRAVKVCKGQMSGKKKK